MGEKEKMRKRKKGFAALYMGRIEEEEGKGGAMGGGGGGGG